MKTTITGLTEQEVKQKQEAGQGQAMPQSITKTTTQIFKENIFTLFNLLNFIIAVMLFAVGAYSNMVFIAIILINIAVGIIQECKAKKLVDNLSILNRPHIKVLRDGEEKTVELSEIVSDDILALESGQQICNDAEVIWGMIEVNESLLTGESDAVVKEEGGELYSGSSVISGKCYAKVTHVGSENYATKLAEEVKKEKKIESELLGSMQKVTKFTSYLIVPLGALLFLEAYLLRGSSLENSVVASSAALLGMLPKGLVLLISVSLANGVIYLSKKNILVQNIYALETLAHVDVLCLDKTGTLTDGKMQVKDLVYLENNAKMQDGGMTKQMAEQLLHAYIAESDDNNVTMQALRSKFSSASNFSAIQKIAFSSKRKWGAICFEGIGTVFIGAPERILTQEYKAAEEMLKQGLRVIAMGLYRGKWENEEELPQGIEPLYLISLEDGIRKNAKETLEYFYKEGVDVKVISGDHVKTVSMVAKKAGLHTWQKAIDMSELKGTVDYDELCENYSVFARVTPKQKQQLVMALKRKGHHVAMTGDGVNDLLALREADCSIAVAEGSDASRQISQIVLMESDFTHLPQVVLQGRRVINNVTRTAGVFFIKTIYSVLLTIFCLVINMPFPFIPIQITLIDAAMEAWPSFLTIFESDTRKVKRRFLKTAISNAMPFALVIIGMIMSVRLFLDLPTQQAQTVMYLLLIFTTMSAVIKSCIPFTKLRTFICVSMVVGTFGVLYILPFLFHLSAMTAGMLSKTLIIFAVGLIILFLLLRGQKLSAHKME